MSHRHSHFFKGLLLTAVAVAAPLIAWQSYALLAQRRDDLESTKDRLHARVELAARQTDNALGRVLQILDFLASRAEMQAAATAEGCTPFVQGLTAIDPLLANVAVVDLHGQPLCRAVDNGRGYPTFAEQPWFKEAMAQEGPYISQPYMGRITGRWQLNVVRRLEDVNGRRIGLLAAAIDVATLADRLFPMDGLPPGSVFGLMAPDGTVLAINRDSQSWIGRKLPADVLQRVIGAATSVAVDAIGLDGSRRVLASAQLRRFGLYAGVGVPRDVVMAPSEARARNGALAALLVALGALALAWFGARRLARPVLALVDTARQFGAGNLHARAEERLPGEFRELALEFNRAIDAFRSSEEARRAQAVAEAASQAKSDFLANMSHEIRTPMNAVIGMTDLAMREELSPKVRDYLAKAHQAAHNLLGIINDILDFSKIEAGKLDVERVEFALQDVLDRLTSVIGLQARKKGQELLINVAPEVPAVLVGDPLRLEQVLVNLCTNAVKFTGEGEIVVVSIRPAEAEQVRISVRDTGPGMSAEQVQQLFQPFNQLDASTTRRHGGTGLGLAISKQLVELMGGELGVRSQLGRGSEFFFVLDVGHAEQPLAEAAAHGFHLRGQRVLVVDDNGEARDIFTTELGRLGASVEVAADGAEAAAKMQAGRFDVVLVDLRLPDVDGFTLIQRLRQRHAASRYLLVTAYGDVDVARRTEAERLDGCLFKPISRAGLTSALEQALRGTRAAVPQPAAAALAPPALRGGRVLLVEDNEFNQIVAGELLGSVAGMAVTIAGDGPAALEQLGSHEFDLVLMDVQMPQMDGFEVTRRIRAQPQLAGLPVIAMTAYAMERDRQRCMDAGMNDFVTKPVEPAELFSVLGRWLARPAVQRELPSGPQARGPMGRHVDLDEGLRRCLGRRDLYDRIVDRFLDSRADDADQLRKADEAGDSDTLVTIAHTTASTAGTLGAGRLSEIGSQLQGAVLDGADAREVHALVLAYVAEHQHVLAELQEHRRQREAAASP